MSRDLLSLGIGRRIEPLDVGGRRIYIREITTGERDELDVEFRKDGKQRCRLIMLSVCDESGRPSFTNADLPAIDALPLSVSEPIFDAAIELNAMSAAAAEELRKNSRTRADDSSTG